MQQEVHHRILNWPLTLAARRLHFTDFSLWCGSWSILLNLSHTSRGLPSCPQLASYLGSQEIMLYGFPITICDWDSGENTICRLVWLDEWKHFQCVFSEEELRTTWPNVLSQLITAFKVASYLCCHEGSFHCISVPGIKRCTILFSTGLLPLQPGEEI